jgi:hypothetical protein
VAAATQPTSPTESNTPTHIRRAGAPAKTAAMPHRAGVMPPNQAMNNRDSGGPRRSQDTVAIAEYTATARKAHMSTSAPVVVWQDTPNRVGQQQQGDSRDRERRQAVLG